MIAKVEPLTTARALRGPFDYLLTDRLGRVAVGSMLVVPFGRQRMLGVVVGLSDDSEVPAEKLVEPLTTLDKEVPRELVDLGLWVAEEYCSTPARGLGLVLPPGTGRGERPRVRARTVLVAERKEAPPGESLGPRQRSALDVLAGGPRTAAEVCREAGCGHATLRALEARGLLELRREELGRRPQMRPLGGRGAEGAALTADQAAALEQVVARLDGAAGERKLLLHGVTGSGKTEVYLRAAAAALERGRAAIVLVPEIALTPQTAGRFEERFGDAVAVLHSKLSAGERHDEWVRLRRGEARVCVGPRSAVFAPLTDVGLIVIDEEHDQSYKQEGDPRYDARRVAERRAEQAGAVLLAGSATPRPESYARLARITLPARVDGRELPPVEVVGMLGAPGALHPRTREELERVRAAAGKAIVLLNRRGWSNFLTCRSCGHVWQCPNCDVSLVLHRAAARIACHHCGHSEQVPSSCGECGSVSLARHGAGTEQLERELIGIVEPLPVFRLDSDEAAGRGAIAEILGRFDAADSGVLVGTQMVAKGHDFPDVTLGVVIDADSTLRFPDLRAEERTFALVAQLAGRSGRGPRGGKVIVQALDPGARVLRHAAQHDADGFLRGELARRELLRYPPYGSLIRTVCLSHEPGPETAAAAALRDAIDASNCGAVVLGPAPLFRLKGRERSQLVVKASEGEDARAAAVRAVREAVEAVSADREHRGVAFAVDVDPQ